MLFCKQTTGLTGLSRHVFSKLVHTTLFTTAVIGFALLGTGNVMAGQLGDCAAEYTTGQGGLNCTAADDGGGIEAVNQPSFCIVGAGLTFDVETTFTNSTNAERYDMRYWVGIDGGDPRETAANGGPAVCSLTSLTIGSPVEVEDGENFPGEDTCGDVAPGVEVPLTIIDTVTVECLPDANGKVVFSSAITWDTTSKNDCSVDNLRDPTNISKSQAACIATELNTESLGRVTVVKSAPEDLTGLLDFTFDWSTTSPPLDPDNAAMNPAAQFTLSDGESQALYSVLTDVGTAVVTITEADPTGMGFTLGSISCPNASVTPIQGGVEVTLSYDEANPSLADVTCTFNNVEIQTNPAMTVSKNSTTGAVTMPGPVTYNYLVSNTGDVELTGVSLADNHIDGVVTCEATTIAVASSINCTATYTVTQADIDQFGSPTPASGLLSNTVIASSIQTPDETTDLDIPITQTPVLGLVKTATPQTYTAASEQIDYQFRFTNTGNVTLYQPFTVTDDIAADEACPGAPASLAPGEFIDCTATYTITQADVNAGSVTNIASGSGEDPNGGVVPSNTDTETVTAVGTGTLILDKTASPSTYDTVGQVISYSYELTNGTNLTLSPQFAIDDDVSTDESCPQPASLAPGAAITCTASHTITQADLDNGFVTNVATGSAQDPDGATVTSNPDTETVTANVTGTLALVKTATPQTYSAVDEVISYSYDLTNNTNVTLYPAFTIDDDVSTDENCPQPASLAPGETVTCTASYTIVQADLDNRSVTNVATGTAQDPDDVTVTSNSDTETVNFAQSGTLVLDKTATPQTYDTVGQVISYSYDLTNGTNTALVPTFAIDDDVSTDENCPQPASLASGETITCTASHTITQADLDRGFVTNVATGSASDGEGTITSNSDTETVNAVGTGSLVLVKTATPQTYSAIGDVISYSYVLTNNTNAELHAPYTIDDDVSTDENCPATPTPLAANGGTVTCTASHTITQADLTAGFVTNLAIGTAQDAAADGQPVQSNQDSETVNSVLINLAKSAAAPTYDVISGRYTVVYTITAFNGGSTAGTYNLVDTLTPATGITLVSAELAYAGGETQTGTTPGPLPYSFTSGEQIVTGEGLIGGATESWTVRAVFDVDPTLVDGDARACVDGDEQAGQGFYNLVTGVDSETDTTDNDACTNLPDPSVDLVKIAESSTYNGDNTYTVVYTVTANNLADGPGFYDLTDTILPGNGITVMQAQLVSYNAGTEDSQTGSLAGALPHTFNSGDQLVTNEALAGARSESWTIEVDFAVDLDSADETFQCSDANGGAGTGFYNEIEGSPSDPDDTNNRACSEPGGRSAGFTVTKDFSDDNTAKVQVTISCNDGFLSASSFLISEFSGGVRFVATSFIPGSMDCEITEQLQPDGYTGSYEAEAGANGVAESIEGGLAGCSFTGVVGGEFTCMVTNTLDEVDVMVYKEWLTNSDGLDDSISLEASAIYRCYNVLDGPDGTSGDQTGDLFFIGNDEESIPVYPSWAGDSWCEVDEINVDSAAEFDDSDCQNVPVVPGDGGSCTIYNTVFFEGIPVLSRNGLMIMVLLMLGLGAVGIRRFA